MPTFLPFKMSIKVVKNKINVSLLQNLSEKEIQKKYSVENDE
jgi:hypothetical protein